MRGQTVFFAKRPEDIDIEPSPELKHLREENARLRHQVKQQQAQIAEHETRPGIPFSGMAPRLVGFTDEEFERMQLQMPFGNRREGRS